MTLSSLFSSENMISYKIFVKSFSQEIEPKYVNLCLLYEAIIQKRGSCIGRAADDDALKIVRHHVYRAWPKIAPEEESLTPSSNLHRRTKNRHTHTHTQTHIHTHAHTRTRTLTISSTRTPTKAHTPRHPTTTNNKQVSDVFVCRPQLRQPLVSKSHAIACPCPSFANLCAISPKRCASLLSQWRGC